MRNDRKFYCKNNAKNKAYKTIYNHIMSSKIYKTADYDHYAEEKYNSIDNKPTADNLFDRMLDAISQHSININLIYRTFNYVFNTVLNNNTDFKGVNIVGTFAKTSYLLKDRKANWVLSQKINNTRDRLRRLSDFNEKQLEDYYLYDFQNICEFIALVYQSDIPQKIQNKFTNQKLQFNKAKSFSPYERMLVNDWDDEYFYGKLDREDLQNVKVKFKDNNDRDWSYLKPFLHSDCQVNLIKPSIESDCKNEYDVVLISYDLIIFEPDYLVDISSIARCFENYTTSAWVDLIHKFLPNTTSNATLLGNFAGQLLDEVVTSPNKSYKQSIDEFFKDNALNLLTCGIDNSFHSDAMIQKENIKAAMNEGLPTMFKDIYKKEDGMLEPSFFSEMLGLQGRMDYLQMDFQILLEQKSGKGAYPQNNYVKPHQTDQHYVQLLLYMLLIRYNFGEKYKKTNLNALLLYSKYKESLLSLNFAPELVFKAIEVRNQMAWLNVWFLQENGFSFLENLSAEALNKNNVDNALWIKYQKKELDTFFNAIHNAREIEKKYFFRFTAFVSREHLLSKIGNKTKDNSGFAAKWHTNLNDKLDTGNIYINLKLIDPSIKYANNPIETIELTFQENQNNDMANFRVGDIVIAYPYKENEPDIRKHFVFRYTIQEITDNKIILRLRFSQSNKNVFTKFIDKPWAIEHDLLESSFSALYRGMFSFLCADNSRRDLLIFKRQPNIDKTKKLKGDYNDFNTLALKIKQAQDFFLIIGPPGTGKTSFGLMTTLKEELLEENSSILLMAYTNRAVDEICEKLIENNIDFIRLGKNFSVSDNVKNYVFNEKVKQCNNINDVSNLILNTRVFVGTLTTINANLNFFKIKQFTLAIIDEASQILEPQIMPILTASNDNVPVIKKFVMIGDEKQLPAVVQQNAEESKVTDIDLRTEILLEDCRLSLLERLLKRYGNDDCVTYKLSRQGRMHPEIAMFPNIMFYNNELKAVPVEHQTKELPKTVKCKNAIEKILKTRRISFFVVENKDILTSDKVNISEAKVIAAIVFKIYEIEKDNFKAEQTLGIIVPYRNQIATIRNIILKQAKEFLSEDDTNILSKITIDTVERYQGSQRKYIIYGFTVQEYYQLQFLTNNSFLDNNGNIIDRKLNVAMTRATDFLIMVGNPLLLNNNFVFFKLIEFIKSRKSYFEGLSFE